MCVFICVCMHAARDPDDLFVPFLPALIVFCLQQALFISKINCRLTVSNSQGLVWVWGSILDVIECGPEFLRGNNVTTPRSSAAGSAASRYSGGQVNLSWRQCTAKLQKVHSLSGHSVLYISRILEKACGQIKLYKQYVQLFSYFTCTSKELFNLV